MVSARIASGDARVILTSSGCDSSTFGHSRQRSYRIGSIAHAPGTPRLHKHHVVWHQVGVVEHQLNRLTGGDDKARFVESHLGFHRPECNFQPANPVEPDKQGRAVGLGYVGNQVLCLFY